MTNSREAKTIPAASKWAAGYAAGAASLQGELNWHREEVARLSTALPKQSGEWQGRAAVNMAIEACAKVAEWTDHGEARPKAKSANDRIAAAIRALAAPSPQEPK